MSATNVPKVNPTVVDDDLDSSANLEPKLSAKLTAMAERRMQRGLELQQQLAQTQLELQRTKYQLENLQKEKLCALDELEEMKKVAEQATVKLNEALLGQRLAEEKLELEKVYSNQLAQASLESAQKRDQAWQLELEANQKQNALDVEALLAVTRELNIVKQDLALAIEARNEALKIGRKASVQASPHYSSGSSSDLTEDIDFSDMESKIEESTEEDMQSSRLIEPLKLEVEDARNLEVKLAERDSLIDKLKLEVEESKASELRSSSLLSESGIQIKNLQQELEKAKESESKTYELLHSLAQQLEQTKNLLEQAKPENQGRDRSVDNVADQTSGSIVTESAEGIDQGCESKVEIALESNTLCPDIKEPLVSFASKLTKEMNLLRNELKLAIEAEGKSTKAMDGFALALKEVTTEVNELKAKLASTEAELAACNMEVEYTNTISKNSEEKCQALLVEARKEIAELKETNDRLKLEADEAFTTWNAKELCFIECIKKAEEEFAMEKENSQRLLEALKEEAEAPKRENLRLRDIIKQAVNEATVAKEAAEIARAENSQLKDGLSDMATELERLKTSEASALENVQQLKSLLNKNGDAINKTEGKDAKKTNGHVKENKKSFRLPLELSKTCRPPNPSVEVPRSLNRVQRSQSQNASSHIERSLLIDESVVKGSKMSMSSRHSSHRNAHSLVLGDSDDFDTSRSQFDDGENDRSSAVQRKKSLLSRVGNLLRRRRSFK